MAEKLYDLVVVTGQYRTAAGEMKNNYEAIGAVFQGEKGKFFTLKATFNPAGLNRDPNRDSIIGNLYRPRSKSADGQTSLPPNDDGAPNDDIPY